MYAAARLRAALLEGRRLVQLTGATLENCLVNRQSMLRDITG